jgi:hypothetical protein
LDQAAAGSRLLGTRLACRASFLADQFRHSNELNTESLTAESSKRNAASAIILLRCLAATDLWDVFNLFVSIALVFTTSTR